MNSPSCLRISDLLATMTMLLLSFASPAQADTAGQRFNPPSSWQEQKKYDFSYSWIEQNERKPFISILEDERVKNAELEKDDKALVEKLRRGKSVPQMLVGITEWKVTRVERTALPQNQGTRVILIGSYRNLHRKLVQFEEWQYFLNSGYGQIQYTEEASEKSRNHAEIAKLLERYHPFGS